MMRALLILHHLNQGLLVLLASFTLAAATYTAGYFCSTVKHRCVQGPANPHVVWIRTSEDSWGPLYWQLGASLESYVTGQRVSVLEASHAWEFYPPYRSLLAHHCQIVLPDAFAHRSVPSQTVERTSEPTAVGVATKSP